MKLFLLHFRADRDQYVIIHEKNIMPGYEKNFKKRVDIDSRGVKYDGQSIMHYSRFVD